MYLMRNQHISDFRQETQQERQQVAGHCSPTARHLRAIVMVSVAILRLSSFATLPRPPPGGSKSFSKFAPEFADQARTRCGAMYMERHVAMAPAYSQPPHSAGIGRSSQQSSAHNAARSGTSHGRQAVPKWSDACGGRGVRPQSWPSRTAHTPADTCLASDRPHSRPSIAQTPGDTRSQGFGFMLPFDVVLPSFSSVFRGKKEEAASANWLKRPSAGQPQQQQSALGAAADELAASVDLALQMHGLAVERSLHLPLHLPLRPKAPRHERIIEVDGTTITIHDGPQSWLPQISPPCCKADVANATRAAGTELSEPWQRWRPRSLEDLLAQQFQRFVSLQDELEMEKERVADQAEQLQKHKRERELLLKKCASLSLDILGALNEVTKVRKERDDALHALQVHTPRLTHV